MTMAVNHAFLTLFLTIPGKWSEYNPLMVFGKSALFFYMAHFFVYLGFQKGFIAIGVFPSDGGGGSEGFLEFWPFVGAWLFGLVLLYPMCLWYARFKGRQGPNSIWRFF
jgi:hypothetical protein